MTSKFKGLEPKSEFRAFPLIKRPGNLGKNKQSITKLFQCTPSLQNTVQKQEDFHKGRITVPLALHNSMCFTTLINRHTGGQIQSLSCPQSWEKASTTTQPVWKNLSVKSWYLSVIGTSKSVNGVGPPCKYRRRRGLLGDFTPRDAK